MSKFDAQSWNSNIAALPGAHVLQTWEWAQTKTYLGWQPLPRIWYDDSGKPSAAAMILQRSIPLRGFAARLRVMYIPKGPLCDWENLELRRRVLKDVSALARRQGAIFVKIDPDVQLGTGIPGQEGAQENPAGHSLAADLQAGGWRFSDEQVQFRNTVLIDLRPEPDELLARMKQKARYNIRLAERKGVRVRSAQLSELEALYQMYAETAVRDDFVIRDQAYYLRVWSAFIQAGMAEALIAEVQGQAVAGLFVFRFARKAWYLYGMSRETHREKMPNYLLQWQAIQRARAAGCEVYDLWGAPDVFDESDPLWGVFRFKEGLGGQVARHLGAWDLPVQPLFYRLYTRTLPRLLDFMRRRGKQRTRQEVS
ncbi:MAG: peptidoglycan bridge formation glycyltransferase FemA/FemB family protein [Anaerolineales bacterium]|nr:peptidoglycan bridge formation glycyltransferase FemA/FemB family protein [Anaerolineales bacterium]